LLALAYVIEYNKWEESKIVTGLADLTMQSCDGGST
jgi:hypothetical protein